MGEFLMPWYLKFWKEGVVAVVLATGGLYITSQNQVINSERKMREDAVERLVTVTAQYKADIAQMSKAIASQNSMIDDLAKQADDAKKQVALANWQSTIVRQNADKQVNEILSRPVAVGCQQSIDQAISTIPDLFWDKLK